MILLLGASGYFGKAFAAELRRRGHSFIPLTRQAFDYTRFDHLFDYLRKMKPEFLINAAGYTTPPGEDGLESSREKTMLANALLPQMIARVCLMTRTPWGHVSSGLIYAGAKIVEGGQVRVERDLSSARKLFESQPGIFQGFSESDEPNFSFRGAPSSFYSGTKALAEEAIRDVGQNYIWRLRLPFNERDEPCNFLRRFQREPRHCDTVDSFSHLEDGIRACLDLWEMRASFGIYNVVNPGAVTSRQIAELIRRNAKTPPAFEYWTEQEGPPRTGSIPPESHCLLDVSKLLGAGVKIRSLADALDETFRKVRQAERSGKALDGPALPPSAPRL